MRSSAFVNLGHLALVDLEQSANLAHCGRRAERTSGSLRSWPWTPRIRAEDAALNVPGWQHRGLARSLWSERSIADLLCVGQTIRPPRFVRMVLSFSGWLCRKRLIYLVRPE